MEQINLSVLDEVLDRYQGHLDVTRPNELYKWEAVRHFKETYDPNANDFSAMLVDAYQVGGKHKLNLAFGPSWFPIGMLDWFSKVDREGTIAALDALYDEGADLRSRMVAFEAWAKGMLDRVNADQVAAGNDPAKNHFQDTRSMSLYLAFMYPESHYYYKTRMYTEAAKFLGIGWPGDKFDKVIAYREMCEQILSHLKEARPDLIEESDSTLGELTEFDPAHHILVQDIVYFITTYDKDYRIDGKDVDVPTDEWFPSKEEYDPGISVDGWEMLLKNRDVFTEQALEIVCRMRDHGGSATCTQLAQRYGETKNFYNSGSVALAKRVAAAKGCPLPEDAENSRWWPVIYVGKHAGKDELGSYVWKLRDELAEALNRVDLSGVNLYVQSVQGQGNLSDNDNSVINGLGNEGESLEEQFVRWCIEVDGLKEVYVSQNRQILAKKRSEAGLMDECLPQYDSAFQCTDCREIEEAYDRAIASPQNRDFHSRVSAALGKYLVFLKWLKARNQDKPTDVDPVVSEPEDYDNEDFLNDVYVNEDDLIDMRALLERKRNLILQGSPGTGKTFCARRLAWTMMGCKDDSRITLVQFHQSTAYDDFVCGYRPDGNGGFAIKDGPFVRACRGAARDPERPHFVIIDEINRANISKVLGELLMLIESDHRGESALLTVSDEELSVPENLYIIGMMNTADRGLALIDYALRRRFAFFEMEPALEHPRFLEQLADCGDQRMTALVEATKEVNKDIAADAALGEGFRIGHSYFCGASDARLVLRYELAPLVREYWFDDPKKVKQELDKLGQVLQ